MGGSERSEGRKVSGVVSYAPLAFATVHKIFAGPGLSRVIGLVSLPLRDELGLTASSLSALYLVATITSAAIMPYFGKALDRHGPRAISLVSILALAGACILLAVVPNAFLLAFALVNLRLWGQGAMIQVPRYTINQFYPKIRGRVQGYAGVGLAIGMAVWASLTASVLESGTLTWRQLYFAFAIAEVAFIFPLSAVFSPSSGARVSTAPTARGPGKSGVIEGVTRAEALATWEFWTFVVITFVQGCLGTGLFFYLTTLPLAQDAGTVSMVFMISALSGSAANLFVGPMLDTRSPHLVAAFGLISLAGALVIAGAPLQDSDSAFMTAVCFGLALGNALGVTRTTSATIYANLFGRAHLGAIQGATTTFSITSTAVGPMLLAVSVDAGTIQSALTKWALVPATMAVLLLAKSLRGHEQH